MKIGLTERALLINKVRMEAYLDTILENQAAILAQLNGEDAGVLVRSFKENVEENYKQNIHKLSSSGLLG